MEEMTLQEIREDSKRRFYNAIDSRSVKIIDSVIQLFRNRTYGIMHTPELAQSEGAYDTYSMLDNFDSTLVYLKYCIANYGKEN